MSGKSSIIWCTNIWEYSNATNDVFEWNQRREKKWCSFSSKIGNYNYKIEASFESLKFQKYIKFLKDLSQIESAINELMREVNYSYNNKFAKIEYQKIIDIIKIWVEEVWYRKKYIIYG